MRGKFNRRTFIELAGVVGAGLIASPVLAQTPPAATSPAPSFPSDFAFTSAPVLMAPAFDGMTVLIGVSHPSTCWVEYGPSPELGQRGTGGLNGLLPYESAAHKIRLTGLKPGTVYHYRVCAAPVVYQSAYKIFRGPTVASPVYSFRTLSADAETCTFQMINDTHEVPETVALLADQLPREPSDFTLWNGDMFNDLRTDEQCVREVLSFHGHAYATSTPVVVSRGNHDVRGVHARHFSRFVDVPSAKPYYSFRHGPAGIIVLDAGEDKVDDHPEYGGMNDFVAYRREQYEWLLNEVKQPHFTSAPWRLVFVHIPLRWRDPKRIPGWWWDGVDKWHAALTSARVHAVFSGHTHNPAMFEPSAELPFYQFVGGANQPDKATLTRVQVTPNSLSVAMRKLNGDIVAQKQIERF